MRSSLNLQSNGNGFLTGTHRYGKIPLFIFQYSFPPILRFSSQDPLISAIFSKTSFIFYSFFFTLISFLYLLNLVPFFTLYNCPLNISVGLVEKYPGAFPLSMLITALNRFFSSTKSIVPEYFWHLSPVSIPEHSARG